MALAGLTACGAAGMATSTGGSAGGSAGDGAGGSVGTGAKVAGPSGSAVAALKDIPVKGRAPVTGYSRARFGPAWADTDHNGCDQRNDILRRDLQNETLKPKTHGCIVLSGTLVDHYTGKTIAFARSSAAAVQIDHVVALENAWVTGAFAWSATKREALATDPLNLLAADGPSNESKGSGDAATWLPRPAYRCDYVARQVAVKTKYGAWMTSAEHKAIAAILATCPKEKLPQVRTIPLGDSSGAGGSAAAPTTGAAGSRSPAREVTAGAFCAPEGATGVSKAGTAMVCSAKAGARARWRSAG